jgi:hypothetical protein
VYNGSVNHPVGGINNDHENVNTYFTFRYRGKGLHLIWSNDPDELESN